MSACKDCENDLELVEREKIGTGMSPRRSFESVSVCLECEQAERQGIPARFRWARLGEGPRRTARLHKRVSDPGSIDATVAAVVAPRILWRGDTGKGKTSLACAALWSRGEGLFVPAWRLARARSAWPLGEGDPPDVRAAKAAPLALIDDLGTEFGDLGTIVEVVLARYDADLPTWVTTWLDKAAMIDRYGGGFTRRLLQDVEIIECPGRGVR